MQNWSPKQIVEELDRYIIGQDEAKRAVAIALRNRYRRSQITVEMREEITPKNIIMMGPTGCGKTEIARRLAKLVEAPFVKVEATKFTEVGYVGRDVESMIRDLVEASIHLVKNNQQEKVRPMAEQAAEEQLLKLLVPVVKKEERAQNNDAQNNNPMALLLNIAQGQQQKQKDPESELSEEERDKHRSKRDEVRAKLQAGELDDQMVEIEVEESQQLGMDMSAMGIDMNMNALGGLFPKRSKMRKMKVSDARKVLIQQESDKLIDMDDVISQAMEKAEQDGIVFIDEIDKIAGKGRNGPDVSREGVQRDILPIIEGSTVTTKYGPVKTDFMLFIAAGAFHVSKVSDLIPELQGRFPIIVELTSLTKEDFVSILKQTDNAITKQYSALLKVDNIELEFSDQALEEIAAYAQIDNDLHENIGARRLHTVMEYLLSDISFNASGDYPMTELVIDENYVNDHLKTQIHERDLKKHMI